MKRYLTEFVGTLMLVFTIAGVVHNDSPAIGIGFALMALIYMGGAVSGAHYNPAVTLALAVLRKVDSRDVGPYLIAQIAGATAGAALGWVAFGHTFMPAPGPTVSPISAVVVEILFTFMLVLTILNVAVSKRTSGNPYFGMAIGGVIVGAALAGGPTSGGAFNPAVGLGPTIVHSMAGRGTLEHLWIYLVGPIAGAMLAAFVFQIQEPAKDKEAEA